MFRVLKLENKLYGLVMNGRPWSYNHCMLISFDPDPQQMSLQGLRAAMYATSSVGPGYEVIFSGALAGASVYHFHLHIHKNPAAIWRNLDERRLRLEQLCQYGSVSRYTLTGWPAPCLLFTGSDIEEVAAVVRVIVDRLTTGDRDIPCNLGFRIVDSHIEAILIPRSGSGEKPMHLNAFVDSWGTFAFQEMAGTVHVLTPEGYRETVGAGGDINASIKEMGLSVPQMRGLVSAFMREL